MRLLVCAYYYLSCFKYTTQSELLPHIVIVTEESSCGVSALLLALSTFGGFVTRAFPIAISTLAH
jgi:hypothetical protein